MRTLREWSEWANSKWWIWRPFHVAWAAFLSRFVHPGAGELWYTSQETNQARAAGAWQRKNTLDLLAGYIGEALGVIWRALL